MVESACLEARLGASPDLHGETAWFVSMTNHIRKDPIVLDTSMRTRLKSSDPSTTTSTIPMDAQEPRRLLVLPRNASSNASIVTLAHPRTLEPTRYYFCPDTGIYEFTRIAAPKASLRSCFLSPTEVLKIDDEQGQCAGKGEDTDTTQTSQDVKNNGYVVKTGELLAATPVDLLFLLLPVLWPKPTSTKSDLPKTLFLSCEDLMEHLAEISKDFGAIAQNVAMRDCMQRRLNDTCDFVEVGDEKMYRLSQTKFLQQLCVKATRAVSRGLPVSMEENFVLKALETPILSAKRPDVPVLNTSPSDDCISGAPTPALSESQSSTVTLLSEDSIASENTDVTVPDQPFHSEIPPEVIQQLRLKTVISYMLDAYCPTQLASAIKALLASVDSPVDLKRCDEYLAQVAKLRAKAQASRSLGDFTRKRSMNEDDETRESRDEKKRKKEDEEKRKKAGTSKGVRDLQKVNTSGMKKMSDFFSKAAAKKKS